MTRFARAEGSKSSNKRSYEEATSWEEMKADMLNQDKKLKKKKKMNKENTSTSDKPKKTESAAENVSFADTNSSILNEDIKKIKKKKKKDKINEEFVTDNQIENNSILNEDIKKIKKKKKKTEVNEELETENNSILNEDIKKIKKKKKKTEVNEELETENQTENNSILNEDIKKSKKKRKRTEVNEELETDNQIKKNQLNKEFGEDNQVKEKKKANTGKKSKKEKEISLEKKKNNYVIEEGIKYKIFKNGKKKTWFDLPYEDNEIMTRYKNFYVKRSSVVELDDLKRSLEEEGIDSNQIANKMLNKERKAHNQLRVQLLREAIGKEKEVNGYKVSKGMRRKIKLEEKSNTQPNKSFQEKREHIEFKYEENDIMTQFDDYWILRDNLNHIGFVSLKKKERIIAEREDGKEDTQLTEEEDLKYKRLMKKEKRREERLLKLKLIELNYDRKQKFRNKRPGRYLGINYESNNMIKFDGFYISQEGAERLNTLKEKMSAKGCNSYEIEQTIKMERRNEERSLKKDQKLFCFKCRRVGHLLSACPESVGEGNEKVEICFKCGSTEHMARNCPANKGDTFSHATCFICGEVGHISRACPDNPRGLFPNGGCCNECGSVEHLKRDCPEFQKRFEDNSIKLPSFNRYQEIDALDDDFDNVQNTPTEDRRSKKATVINFDD